MKNKLLAVLLTLILLAAFLSSACQSKVDARLNAAFDLAVGQTARLDGEGLSIRFVTVESDSRCPQGVQCVWAGEAKCRLLVSKDGRQQELEITQSGSSPGSIDQVFETYRFDFQLNPYPQSGVDIKVKDYYLSLTVYR